MCATNDRKMAIDTLQARDSDGTKGCHSALNDAGLGMKFKMSRFNLQENGNTISERGKEGSLDRLKHLKMKPSFQMPAGHDGTVDKENNFGELSLMLKTPSSERSFQNRKNDRNRVRLIRSVAPQKAGELISKRPTQLGKLQLTTHPNLPKVLDILSPSFKSGTTDGSANSSVPGPNIATQWKKPITYATLTPPKTFHSAWKKISKNVDSVPRALASSVPLDIRGNSPRQRNKGDSARKYARYSGDDVGVQEATGVVTSTVRRSAGPVQKKHRKGAAVARERASTVELGNSESSGLQHTRRADVSIDSECSETQETGHPKRVVDEAEEVFLAACTLLALSRAGRNPRCSESTDVTSSSTRPSYSSDSGTDPYATVSEDEIDADEELGDRRESGDPHDRRGREISFVNKYSARGTSVLPRPGSKQRYRSVASLMDETRARR